MRMSAKGRNEPCGFKTPKSCASGEKFKFIREFVTGPMGLESRRTLPPYGRDSNQMVVCPPGAHQ
jgi:hypothetical protein